MLRASAHATDQQLDLLGVGDETVDAGVRGAMALSALTEAAVLRDPDEMPVARERAVTQLGAATTVRALAVAGTFEMMNRLLDAIGVGPSVPMRSIGTDIGVPLPARFDAN